MTDRGAVDRMLDSLHGLATGDAFGEQFFVHRARATRMIRGRELTPGPWPWTDDTSMALGVSAVLAEKGTVAQDLLAAMFGALYRADPFRGYGPAMHALLVGYVKGHEWRHHARRLFSGQGSFGNGAAMRVAPLGAYFAGDIERAASEAALSAEVTHCHREGTAGAIAVAVAAALAGGSDLTGAAFIDTVVAKVPASDVRSRLERSIELLDETPSAAAGILGNGSEISAQDTVPFCLWAASRRLGDYELALWETVEALGDRDTTCAIVGGVVAARTGREAIPEGWRVSREELPSWVLELEAGRDPSS